MRGKGRWMDNLLIERLWHSVKHEWILLYEYNTTDELETLLSDWFTRYNEWRTIYGQRQGYAGARAPAGDRLDRYAAENGTAPPRLRSAHGLPLSGQPIGGLKESRLDKNQSQPN